MGVFGNSIRKRVTNLRVIHPKRGQRKCVSTPGTLKIGWFPAFCSPLTVYQTKGPIQNMRTLASSSLGSEQRWQIFHIPKFASESEAPHQQATNGPAGQPSNQPSTQPKITVESRQPNQPSTPSLGPRLCPAPSGS